MYGTAWRAVRALRLLDVFFFFISCVRGGGYKGGCEAVCTGARLSGREIHGSRKKNISCHFYFRILVSKKNKKKQDEKLHDGLRNRQLDSL